MLLPLIRFLITPVLAGLVIALTYIVITERLGVTSTHEIVMVERQEAMHPLQSTVSLGNTVSYADAVSKAQPAVVNISTTRLAVTKDIPMAEDPLLRRFFGMEETPRRQKMQSSLGSGVVISPSGYILTSNHVISGADEIKVGIADGREAIAQVIGTDPETDLALLYVDIPNLPVITLADTDNIRVGDVVLAIGNPFNIGQTVTKGIISALGRPETDLSSFVDYIQTDAAINPGNSGGALINAYGDLIGINTAMYSASGGSHGIGFAIPIFTAKQVVKELVQHGQVIRGWVGIEPKELNPALAQALNLPDVDGLLVLGIFKDGPAHRAGVFPGDIITHLNGIPVISPREAMNQISDLKPGARVTIRVIRQRKPLEILVSVGARPTPNT